MNSDARKLIEAQADTYASERMLLLDLHLLPDHHAAAVLELRVAYWRGAEAGYLAAKAEGREP